MKSYVNYRASDLRLTTSPEAITSCDIPTDGRPSYLITLVATSSAVYCGRSFDKRD